MGLTRGLVRLAAISISAHIKVEMIAMGGVVIGAENGPETLACAVVDSGQKLHLAAAALPVILDRYPAPVGQHEGRYVDRIGMGMFRQFARPRNIAATVAAHGFDPLEVAAKILARRPFHRIFGPGGKFAGQFALDRSQIGYVRADIQQLDAVDLALACCSRGVVGCFCKSHTLQI